jgi:hypothetical protein
MGKTLGLLFACLILIASSAANATVFSNLNADPDANISTIKISGLAAIVIPRTGPGGASLSATKPPFTLFIDQSVWATSSYGPGTSLFTGVPFISNLIITFVGGQMFQTANSSSTMQPSTRPAGAPWSNTSVANPVGPGAITGMIAYGTPIKGQGILGLTLGTKMPVIELLDVGRKPVATATAKIGTPALVTIDITMGPWFRNSITMTNLTTNYVQLPARNPGEQTGLAFTLNPSTAEEVKTFTVGGNFVTSYPDNELLVASEVQLVGTLNFPSTLNGTGTISLVTPLRMVTGEVAGTIPGFARMKFSFVPEPRLLLLMVSGAIGLILFGRNRMRP